MKFLSRIILAQISFALTIFFLAALAVAAQNRFDGYNIIVDAMDTQTVAAGACATRYVPTTTQISIADLDASTPMKLQSCAGANYRPVRQTNATTAVVQSNDADFKWCFIGEDKMYRITFPGDKFSGKIVYNWIATPEAREIGLYNVRDFGAKGDGKTDDTTAIRSALAFVATRNGGRLFFPDGDYAVGNSPDYPNFKGLTIPSGIVIEGTGSNNTGAAINNVVGRNASRITLNGQNRALFRIGECTERLVVRDIELFANSDTNTYGVEAVGAFTSSQDIYFDRVAFTRFGRGIYGHALPPNNQQWQFDFVKINSSRFVFCREAGIFIDFWNSDWAIRSSLILSPPKTATVKGDGIRVLKAGGILIEDTFGGAPPGNVGGDFINVDESGHITIIASQSEKMTNSIVFGDAREAGNQSFNITLINSIFGDPIDIKARKTIVSIGNGYAPGTWKLHPEARIYSTGDRFCYDGYILACNGAPGEPNFVGGKIVFSTGQPGEGSLKGRPTVFGHDVQFTAPVQVPNVPFNDLPKQQTLGNGSFLYCTNCRRSTAPCQTGGSGSPAMFVNGKWDCL